MISVIIPIYKVEDYLGECIESVVNQTMKDLEIILVDDGSPDRCPQMCDEWAKRDSRIRVIHKPNGGLSDARNAGIDSATGEYIAFVDSDDFMELDCFEKLYNALMANPDCAISSCSLWIYIDGKIQPPPKSWDFNEVRYVEPEDYADRMLLMKSQHTSHCKLFKTETLKNVRFRVGRNNEDILFALDFYPIVEREGYRIVEIPDKLLYYRQHSGSICHSQENPFFITEARNRVTVMKEVKGKKPKVYEEYRRKYIHNLANMLTYKLNNLSSQHIDYWRTCCELWYFSDAEVHQELKDSELATFLHCKYLAPMMWLKYWIKLIRTRELRRPLI